MAWFWRSGTNKSADPVGWVRHLVPSLALFKGLVPEDLDPFLTELEWFSLPGGTPLMHRGDTDEGLFIITAGSLGMWLPDPAGEDYLAGQFVPYQTVGELSLLSGGPRTATLIALRDSELLRISPDLFQRIVARHPVVMENLAQHLARRLKESMEGRNDPSMQPVAPKTITLLPITAGVPCRETAERIVASFQAQGLRAILLDRSAEANRSDWFHNVEAEHDHVIYLSDGEAAGWSRQCVRQADRILLMARSDALSPYTHPMEEFLLQGPRRFVELAILFPSGTDHASGCGAWIERLRPDFHFNMCFDDAAAVDRLVRHMSGRAVGLVLAGGGARGFAHLGVIRALREAGVAIDRIGGTSMGALVAACVASGWDDDEIEARMRATFVETNPLNDYTLPFVSFVRGRKVQRLLKEHFGTRHIEDLWLPYYCVSANLTRGRQMVHTKGLIWQALRASIAIPGVLPPVVRRGDVLVDGAVLNNFPVTVMSEYRRGPVIGVDVEDHNAFLSTKGSNWREHEWGVLGDTVSGGPGIVSLLMRSGTVNSEIQSKLARARADLLFDPPIAGIGVRDWQAFDQAIEAGYVHAQAVLQTTDLSRYTANGRALGDA